MAIIQSQGFGTLTAGRRIREGGPPKLRAPVVPLYHGTGAVIGDKFFGQVGDIPRTVITIDPSNNPSVITHNPSGVPYVRGQGLPPLRGFGAILEGFLGPGFKECLSGFGDFSDFGQTTASQSDSFSFDATNFIITDNVTGVSVPVPSNTAGYQFDSSGNMVLQDSNGNQVGYIYITQFNAPAAQVTPVTPAPTPTPTTTPTPTPTAPTTTPAVTPSTGASFLQTLLSTVVAPTAAQLRTSPTVSTLTPYYNAQTGLYQSTPVVQTGTILGMSPTTLLLIGGGIVAVILLTRKKDD